MLEYAANMLDRVTAGLAISQAEVDAVAIARHLLATEASRLNERELYQSVGFRWARDRERRAAAFAVLASGSRHRTRSRAAASAIAGRICGNGSCSSTASAR